MRIEQVYYFVEVVKAGSISRAAEKIFITQQSVSQALSNLEKELGVKLLIRAPKKIYLTAQGEVFYEQAKKVLVSFGNLKTSVVKGENITEQHSHIIQGTLQLYCSTMVNRLFMKKFLENFQNEYANISIKIQEVNNLNIFPMMVEQQNGLAVISVISEYFAEILKEEYKNDLWYEAVYRDRLLACVSHKSPLAKKNIISIYELLNYPLALSANCCCDFNCMQSIFHEPLPAENIILKTADYQWIKDTVAKNKAVTFLPQGLINEEPWATPKVGANTIAFVPLKENLHLTIVVLKALDKGENNSINNLFLQEIRHYFATI